MMAPNPPSSEGIDKQQPTGNRSGEGGWWQASKRQQSHGNDDGQRHACAVDVKAGGWMGMVKMKSVAMVTAKVTAVSTPTTVTVAAVAVTTQ